MTASKTFYFLASTLANLGLLFIAYWIIVNSISFIRSRKSKTPFQWKRLSPDIMMATVCFSILGMIIGLLIGLSQSPVVGVAIPALLTFYSGFLTFFLAKDIFRNQEIKTLILVSITFNAIFMMYGLELGTREKNTAVTSAKNFDLYYLEKQLEIQKKYK